MKTYNTKQIAEICQCHYTTILEYIGSGSLNAFKVGRRWVITQSALDDFLKIQENKAVRTLQASAKRSGMQCYANETAFGMSILQRQVARELDARLAQPINRQPKNYTTS